MLVSLFTALFIAKESFPEFNRFFIPFIFFSVAFSLAILIVSHKLVVILNKKGSAGQYLLFYLVVLFFVLAVRNSDYDPHMFRNEFFNLAAVSVLIVMYFCFVHSVEQFIRQRNLFFRILFYIMTFVSVAGLVKFWFYLRGVDVPWLFTEGGFALGTSLIVDADTFITAIVAAMIGVILFKFRQKSSFPFPIIYHGSFLLMFYTVIWSGSKKGLILMITLFIVIVLLRIFFLLHKSRVRNYNLIRNLNILILVLGFSGLLGTWAITMVEGDQKERWISRLGFDRYYFKSEMTMVTFSHISIFNHQADLQRWYDRLWGQQEPDIPSMQDKISFVLTEQENIFLAPERSRLTVQTYDQLRQHYISSFAEFNAFSRKEKITGQGFGYLDHHARLSPDKKDGSGVLFLNNNYLVSALMYSGIAGVAALILLLLQVFRIYWVNRRELLAMFAIFMVMSAIYLLSHNTILTNPLLLVAVIMPLRYRGVSFRSEALQESE